MPITGERDQMEEITRRLERAKAAPLDIDIDTGDADEEPVSEYIKAAMVILQGRISQWRMLRIRFDFPTENTDDVFEEYGIPHAIAENLQALDICPLNVEHFEMFPSVIHFPLSTPRLHTLAVNSINLHSDIIQSVTHLSLGADCPQRFPSWDTLSDLQYLEYYTNLEPKTMIIDADDSVTALPSLTHLSTTRSSMIPLTAIQMPSLTTILLTCTGSETIISGTTPPILELSTVKHVHFQATENGYEDVEFLPYLKYTPGLVTLKFTGCSPSPDDLTALLSNQTCPHLESIYIHDSPRDLTSEMHALGGTQIKKSGGRLKEWYLRLEGREEGEYWNAKNE